MVGNPPFAGKNTLATGNRTGYGGWLQTLHEGAHGNADLVSHFFRRAFTLLRTNGVFGLIVSTILGAGGNVLQARRRLRWPGEAAVVVSVIHITKGKAFNPVLDGKPVRRISASWLKGIQNSEPIRLAANARKAFSGSYVLGMGFTFDDELAEKGSATRIERINELVRENPLNSECIFPYVGGDDINRDPNQPTVACLADLNRFMISSRRPVGW